MTAAPTGARRRPLLAAARGSFVWGYAAITVFGFAFVAISAFKSNAEIFADPFALPESWGFDNLTRAWTTAHIGDYFVNTALVAVVTTVLSTLLAATVAYTIVRMRFPGSSLVYLAFAIGVGVPLQALLVPTFIVMNNAGLLDSLTSLVLVYTAFALPKAVFLLAAFMKDVPGELEEAALIDGAGELTIFRRVVMPLCRPALATVAVLEFLGAWNEYVYASVLIRSPENRTISLGLASFSSEYASDYGLIAAGVLITVVPVVIVYVLLQRHVVAGLSTGALKG
ncbi:carbohydrate ABC transporter permease [Jiangella rhizosphaerae]|uniref:Carbohydrate ABC transporter permease n=1 Tax=Jiangella rhizosphaerae TaxID=2293569 RepID=A0A418KKB6_9ACTN|nr:carbohydrate ABC transporter permease [Jiangella rhizosphaerae]RIQ16186.1 carbohydrate ABC transporter permease [Jiangella rhizosphaerae]